MENINIDIPKGSNNDFISQEKRTYDTIKDDDDNERRIKKSTNTLPEFNINKFCYRHDPDIQSSPTHTACYKQDLKKLREINQSLSKLPINEQSEIHHIFSKFNKSNDKIRKLIIDGILSSCCFPQLSYISTEINDMIKIDFISILPQELSLKILSYLDCQSLCNSMLVCSKWNILANNNMIWYHMCKQHIDKKCPNCGWGLPSLLKKKRKNNTDTTVTNTHNPWKIIYKDRFKVELNWRKANCEIIDFKGHLDGVLSLQFNYKYLFTGSYDSTVAIWDLYNNILIRRLNGHTDGVKALYFDDKKLITGSLDKTIKIWNYVTGQCISTYRGHTDSVMSVDAFKKIIVSGSADKTVKVWHIESRTCYTLKGHTEWVNCVKLHPKSFTCFSCSDDTTIRMWDIRTNTCIKVFKGHVGQVQKVIPLTIIDIENLVSDISNDEDSDENNEDDELNQPLDDSIPYPTHLLSCSLDNTIKLWNVKTGKCIRTQFGHVEGVWDIAADNFRIISGSHDGCLKVWDLQNGQCLHTFQGRRLQKDTVQQQQQQQDENATGSNNNSCDGKTSPISCVSIGDSEFFSGDESGYVKMYRFDHETT
ncbi:hypothetical protein KAFR_0I01880 [Kazachstania africana CBS 2517]|uniref:F-box domain-containing protein n=1 Tax=Kazachstania africana (strain ATCC 22294 / BCRC 22015 / CBS 2517 / CECT 1963 / NBRC 1671 / NRRL Y-8276) TaxID=1071382 RepID=H2B018_KAZAF|nr:hypothetical protein KAFR_0I01880 [Kazachstania africana CBS 2517]CCF59968.1 hypothetical protein KAFR_0I01880 [Kazachstania africana CBS 2517]